MVQRFVLWTMDKEVPGSVPVELNPVVLNWFQSRCSGKYPRENFGATRATKFTLTNTPYYREFRSLRAGNWCCCLALLFFSFICNQLILSPRCAPSVEHKKLTYHILYKRNRSKDRFVFVAR